MSTPFLGQISVFGFNFAPTGWALCNGQSLAINQNQALFSLLGTTYGGNGINTFQLPNLQGSVAIMVGPGFVLGQVGGEPNVTLTTAQLPSHTHGGKATTANANSATAIGNFPATGSADPYSTAAANTQLGTGTTAGSSQPHDNMQPYLAVTFCIALQGIFPSRS
ncbi:MAG TPA: tail fiber protein [Terracidiphilus sp.]|jgi:microcystin-dependent protein